MHSHIHKWFTGPAFTSAECDDALELAGSYLTADAQVIGSGQKKTVRNKLHRNCKTAWITREEKSHWLYEKMQILFHDCNDNTFKFNIDGGMENIQFLDYPVGGFFNRHVDNGSDAVARRKLTMIVQLTEPTKYIGGRLRIESMLDNKYASKERGSAVVFPSHLWHKAHPVWLGRRQALVAWYSGEHPLR